MSTLLLNMDALLATAIQRQLCKPFLRFARLHATRLHLVDLASMAADAAAGKHTTQRAVGTLLTC